jgi:hypothetical protein
LRGGVPRYAAQATPEFDAEIAEKGHLWMETNCINRSPSFGHRDLTGSPEGDGEARGESMSETERLKRYWDERAGRFLDGVSLMPSLK